MYRATWYFSLNTRIYFREKYKNTRIYFAKLHIINKITTRICFLPHLTVALLHAPLQRIGRVNVEALYYTPTDRLTPCTKCRIDKQSLLRRGRNCFQRYPLTDHRQQGTLSSGSVRGNPRCSLQFSTGKCIVGKWSC